MADESAVEISKKSFEEKNSNLKKKHGATFIITFCSLLIAFYIVASLLAHYAYREFKGIAEDVAGGSVNDADGNVLAGAIISKREGD